MYHEEEGIILYRQIDEKDMNHTIVCRVSSNGSILTGAFPFSFSLFSRTFGPRYILLLLPATYAYSWFCCFAVIDYCCCHYVLHSAVSVVSLCRYYFAVVLYARLKKKKHIINWLTAIDICTISFFHNTWSVHCIKNNMLLCCTWRQIYK